MDFLYSFDLAIFYFINHSLSTGFLDKFFSIITDVNNWYIAYIILAGIALYLSKLDVSVQFIIIGIIFGISMIMSGFSARRKEKTKNE